MDHPVAVRRQQVYRRRIQQSIEYFHERGYRCYVFENRYQGLWQFLAVKSQEVVLVSVQMVEDITETLHRELLHDPWPPSVQREVHAYRTRQRNAIPTIWTI